MELKDILKKIAKKEELTEEEVKFLEGYNPDENRIPKARLDGEIEKRKQAEQELSDLKTKVDELQAKLDEANDKGLTEAEKLKKDTAKQIEAFQKQVAKLTEEKNNADASLAAYQRKAAVGEIAKKHGFADADYLSYLMQQKELKLDDEPAVTSFMSELGKTTPGLFKADIRGGSGTNPNGNTGVGALKTRMDELLKKPSLTIAESSEVIELQNRIREEAGKSPQQQQTV